MNVTGIDLASAVELVLDAARSRRPMGVSALAVHGIMSAVKDPTFQYRLNQLEMVVPDGQPVRWALDWLYDLKLPDRVPGPDLMQEVCNTAAAEELGIFLYGSTKETLGQLQGNLKARIPGLVISGAQASRFRPATEAERVEDLEAITESGASIALVGLGCPRQEIWTYENRLDLSMPVLAVGAAFDYHAGLLRRAPRWVGRAGLEWAFRLVQEPRRLAGRYLKLNPAFLALLALQKSGVRRFESHDRSIAINQVRPS